jgi:hypothetical protein
MEFRTSIQALTIALAVGGAIRIVLEMVFLRQLNVLSLAVCMVMWFLVLNYNELFREIVTKYKRR